MVTNLPMLWAPAVPSSCQESHLGRGVSKQAARSFQRLLRRTAPVEAQQTLAKLLAAEPLSETSRAWRIFLGMMILKVIVVEDIDVDVWYWIGLVELSYTVFFG